MKADRFGYAGKIVRVNLENRDIRIENPDESYYEHYLGGRGVIMHTLLTEVPPHTDPLGPDNKLIFAKFMGSEYQITIENEAQYLI